MAPELLTFLESLGLHSTMSQALVTLSVFLLMSFAVIPVLKTAFARIGLSEWLMHKVPFHEEIAEEPSLGRIVKETRMRRCLTQEQLAGMACVTRRTVRNIEAGGGGAESLRAVFGALDIPLPDVPDRKGAIREMRVLWIHLVVLATMTGLLFPPLLITALGVYALTRENPKPFYALPALAGIMMAADIAIAVSAEVTFQELSLVIMRWIMIAFIPIACSTLISTFIRETREDRNWRDPSALMLPLLAVAFLSVSLLGWSTVLFNVPLT